MRLRQRIEEAIASRYGGDIEEAAEAWCVTRGQVLRAMRGAANPPRVMQRDLGLVQAYVPKELVEQGVAHPYKPARKPNR